MRLPRLPLKTVLLMIGLAGAIALGPACRYLTEAHAEATVIADGAPAVPSVPAGSAAVTAAPDPSPMPTEPGWLVYLMLGLAALAGLAQIARIIERGLAWLAPRTENTIDDAFHAKVDRAADLLEEVRDGLSALAGRGTGTSLHAPPRKPQSGRAAVGLLAVLALCGVVLATQGCAAARSRGSAAAGAFIDCQAPNVAGTLAEIVPLAKQAVMVAIGGTGDVDLGQLRAAATPLKSDLGRCALAAAIAALSTPAAPDPDAPASAPLEVDGPGLRAAFAKVRGELGWAPVVVGDGTVL